LNCVNGSIFQLSLLFAASCPNSPPPLPLAESVQRNRLIANLEGVMERVCFRFYVRTEMIDEYKQRHAAVWPEMLQALTDCGWKNYSIFLNEKEDVVLDYAESCARKYDIPCDDGFFIEKIDRHHTLLVL
jgi:hypothetical protein